MSRRPMWKCPKCGKMNEVIDEFELEDQEELECDCGCTVHMLREFDPYYTFTIRIDGQRYDVSTDEEYLDCPSEYEEAYSKLNGDKEGWNDRGGFFNRRVGWIDIGPMLRLWKRLSLT